MPKPGVPWNEITIVTADDIQGENHVPRPGEKYDSNSMRDQPFLAKDFVNHPEEPIVLLAHPDKWLLEKARQLVETVIGSLKFRGGMPNSLPRSIPGYQVHFVMTLLAFIIFGSMRALPLLSP